MVIGVGSAQVPILRWPSSVPFPSKAGATTAPPGVILDANAAAMVARAKEQVAQGKLAPGKLGASKSPTNPGGENPAGGMSVGTPDDPASAATNAKLPIGAGRTKAPTPRSLTGLFNQLVTNRLDVSGRRVLSVHRHDVQGDREAFNTLNYAGEGGQFFTNQGQLSLRGKKVLGFLDFDMQVADNRLQDPDQRRVTLNFEGHPYRMAVGDINGSLLNTNEFSRFSRTLQGVMGEYRFGRFAAKGVRSQTRGAARTVSVTGNNSSGPYYLQSGRIRPDTLEVRVDGQEMRIGVDYELNADLGAISFLNRIIPPTSVIVATYESAAFNEQRGTIQGFGFAYDLGRFGRLGFSQVEQVGSGVSQNNSKVELFQGGGNPAVPYDLDYEPTPGTVQVRVGTILQVPGVDYTFDTTYPRRFFFTRYIDPNQTISVTYRPTVIQTAVGDRRVTGFDWRMPFLKRTQPDVPLTEIGMITLSQADGRALGGNGATARGARLDYRNAGLRVNANVRDVPPGFVTVESRGFARNERASEVGLEYGRGAWSVNSSLSNSSVATRASIGSDALTIGRFTTANVGVRYAEPDGFRWGLTQSQSRSRLTDETRVDTTTLSSERQFGRVGLTLAYDRQIGRGPVNTNGQVALGRVALDTLRSGINWNAGSNLTLSSRFGVSSIDSPSGRGRGNDTSIGAEWRPNGAVAITTSYTDSNSGSLATLGGLSLGQGFGYGGNGFSSGGLGDTLNAGQTTVRTLQSTAAFRVSDRFNVNLRYYQSRTSGELLANAAVNGFGAGLSYDLGRVNLFTLSLDQTDGRALNAIGGDNRSTSWAASLSGSPPGRVSYSLAAFGLVSRGGSTLQGQDSLTWDVNLNYNLKDRQRLLFGLTNGRSIGYYGQREMNAMFGYEYQIFRNIALRGLYRVRDIRNADSSLTSGNYRSRGFDIELTFDF
ncbi:MAG: hypothetical protein SFX74_07040 [Fimbriimonadaceae bacterium]|nr:hypothetical protein [Fimbriimonadaceae bacterium]